jgi:hypothetical protein
MLMLARIDGKSPVEYLSEAGRPLVRSFALTMLPRHDTSLAAIAGEWFSRIKSAKVEP